MKLTLLAGCALACVALSGCVSPGAVTGAGPVQGVNVQVLAEVNRHLELCHRTYSWPFAVMIDCPAQTPVAAKALTAADVAALIDSAVAKLAAAITSPAK